MAITASDVIQDDDVRAIIEKLRNQYLQTRRAFRNHDGTGLDSNSFEFPVSDSNLDGEAIEVGEGDSYPRSAKDHSSVTAAYKKYGVELTITDEAVQDSAVDVEMDAEEDMIRAEERRVETVAYNVLDSNKNSSVSDIDANSNNNDVIEQVDLETAREEAYKNEFDLSSTIVIGAAADYSDYISMADFDKATDLGDLTARTGALPEGDLAGEGLLGMALDFPVYLDNIGNISAGDAYVVDTSNYGWESERDPLEVISYREEQKDQTVFKVRGRWDWVATQPEANLKISS